MADHRKLPRSLSHSSMAAYESCPKKFEFSRIDRIPDPPGRAMLIGTFAHSILEELMKVPGEDRTMEAARGIARTCWDGNFSVNSDFRNLGLTPQEALQFRKDSWMAVEGYFAIEDPAGVDVVAVEKKVETQLGDVPLTGFVDRIERDGDKLVVSDYKTGRVPSSAYKGESLAQPYLYAAMLSQLGTPVDRYRMLYVNNKTEIAGSLEPSNVDSAIQRASDTWGAIQDDFKNGNFETRTSKLCNWCGFKSICPAWT